MAARPHVSIRLFENPFLERLSHVHPVTPFVVWAPIVSYLLYRSIALYEMSALVLGGIAVAGLFVWSLTEYLLHRFLFHIETEHPFGKRFFFIIHGNHHADPQDPTRLVMPPVAGLALGAIFYALFYLVMGPVWTQPFFAFFIIGYLIYDYTHYAIHHFRPRTAFGKKVKQSHMLHHYSMHDARWGVSSPFWDHVFGTMEERPRRNEVRSEAKSVGQNADSH